MWDILKVAFFSILPVSELRGGIFVGLAIGMDPVVVYLTAVIFNSLSVPLIFFFMDHIHLRLLKYKKYEAFFNNYIHKKRSKIERSIGKRTEFIALFLFVALPFPMTGAWTGSILAWFFNIKRKKAYASIILGILTAGIIVTLAFFGVISLF